MYVFLVWIGRFHLTVVSDTLTFTLLKLLVACLLLMLTCFFYRYCCCFGFNYCAPKTTAILFTFYVTVSLLLLFCYSCFVLSIPIALSLMLFQPFVIQLSTTAISITSWVAVKCDYYSITGVYEISPLIAISTTILTTRDAVVNTAISVTSYAAVITITGTVILSNITTAGKW